MKIYEDTTTEIRNICNILESIEDVNIAPGFYVVTDDFKIDFGGAWRIKFVKGTILEYKNDKTMLAWNPIHNKWIRKAPAIQGETKLDLSQYGRLYDQREQLNNFNKNTKKITSDEAKKLCDESSSSDEKVMTVSEALVFLKTLKRNQVVRIKVSS